MPGWLRDPELAAGETVVFRRAATLRQGRRSVGGEVSVTSLRLLFTPNQLEHVSRAPSVDVALAEVGPLALRGPGASNFGRTGIAGVLRPQLEIGTPDRSLLLILSDAEALAAALDRARPSDPG